MKKSLTEMGRERNNYNCIMKKLMGRKNPLRCISNQMHLKDCDTAMFNKNYLTCIKWVGKLLYRVFFSHTHKTAVKTVFIIAIIQYAD